MTERKRQSLEEWTRDAPFPVQPIIEEDGTVHDYEPVYTEFVSPIESQDPS